MYIPVYFNQFEPSLIEHFLLKAATDLDRWLTDFQKDIHVKAGGATDENLAAIDKPKVGCMTDASYFVAVPGRAHFTTRTYSYTASPIKQTLIKSIN